MILFMVLSSHRAQRALTARVHSMNAETAPVASNLCTKPIDLSQEPACSMPVNYIYHHYLVLLLSPNVDTHFTVQQRVEG